MVDTAEAIPRPPRSSIPTPPRSSIPTPRASEAGIEVQPGRKRAGKRVGAGLVLLAVLGAGTFWLLQPQPASIDEALVPALPLEPAVTSVPVLPVEPAPEPPRVPPAAPAEPAPEPRLVRKPPRPRPPPAPPPPSEAAASPTGEELHAALAQLLTRLEKVGKQSPPTLKRINERLSQRIADAKTLEERKKIRSDIEQTH